MTVFDGPSITIQNEADPIFNPLDGLAKALEKVGVSVAPMLYVEGGAKIGGRPDTKQITWTSADDIPDAAAKIAHVGKVVRFLEMFSPKDGVISVHTCKYRDIWARYVSVYDCPTDQISGRWDVIVEPI